MSQSPLTKKETKNVIRIKDWSETFRHAFDWGEASKFDAANIMDFHSIFDGLPSWELQNWEGHAHSISVSMPYYSVKNDAEYGF